METYRKIIGGFIMCIETREKYILVEKGECLRREINELKKENNRLKGCLNQLGSAFDIENYKKCENKTNEGE